MRPTPVPSTTASCSGIALVVALAAALVSAPAPVVAQEPSLVGTYESGTMRLVFGVAERYRLTAGSLLRATGTWATPARGVITLREEAGPGSCSPGSEGRYRWRLASDTLRLEVLDDPCVRRVDDIVRREWRRSSEVERVALLGGTVVDPATGTVRRNMTVLIGDGVIEDVFVEGAKQLPPRVEPIPVHGRWVIPGLIDTNAEIDPDGPERTVMLRRMRNALYGGVTSARVAPAGDLASLVALQESGRAGEVEMPTLVLPALVVTADTVRAIPFVDHENGSAHGRNSAPPPALALAVQRWVGLGQARERSAPGVEFLDGVDVEQVRDVLLAARWLGLRGWSRASLPGALPSELVAGGVGLMSDASLLDAEGGAAAVDLLLARMAGGGVALEPLVTRALDRGVGAEVIEVTRRAFNAGVPVVAGTLRLGGPEFGATPDIHREMQAFVEEIGMTPREALAAATTGAAAALGLGDRLGRVAPGYVANLVVLMRDPLADIRNTRSIELTMLGGDVYRPAGAR